MRVLLVELCVRVRRGVGPAGTAGVADLVGGGHGGVERGEVAHHALVLLLLVRVHRLRVLPQVVEPRELLPAVAGERALAGVFPVCLLLAACSHPTIRGRAYLMCRARCSLREKTMRHSP